MVLGGTAHRGGHRQSDVVRMSFDGASSAARAFGVDLQQGVVNVFGGKPSMWLRDIATYGGVDVRGLYPGITLHYYGAGRRLEYDVRLAAHADVARVRARISGVSGIRLSSNGDLRLAVASGELRWVRPVAYQLVGGRRAAVAVRYRLLNTRTIGFALGRYDHALTLVIDPVLSYASFFGYSDSITGIALDRAGNTYITGYSVAAIITNTHMLQMNRVRRSALWARRILAPMPL